MKDFYNTIHCSFEVHCGTCRLQTDEGRQWRESIAKNFSVEQIDFECPQGKPWTKERIIAPAKSRGLGDSIATLIRRVTRGKVKPCSGCKERQKKLNQIFPYKTAQA